MRKTVGNAAPVLKFGTKRLKFHVSSITLTCDWGYLCAVGEENPPERGYRILSALAFDRFTEKPLLLTLLLAVLGLASLPVHGDVFELRDGKKIEGNIVREIGDLVSIRKLDGSIVTIDRSEIASVKKSATPLDEYRKRADSVRDDDLQGQIELAKWCTNKGLKTQASLHWKIVIGLSPDNFDGRKALGYVWIGGDWYLAGSPEALARQKELDSTPAEELPRIPDELPLPEWDRPGTGVTPDLPPVSGDAKVIILQADEKTGRKKVESSGLKFQLNRMGGNVRFTEGDLAKAEHILKVKMRVYFVRQQDFYGAPIANIFQGEAQIDLLEKQPDGKMKKLHSAKVKMPFSASTNRSKEVALRYTYYKTLEAVASRVSRWSWLKRNGAKPLKAPEE